MVTLKDTKQELRRYLWWSRVLRAGADPTPAPDRVREPLVVAHLRETQRPLATHAHRQSPAAGVRFLHIHNLEEHQQTRQSLLFISMQKAFQESCFFCLFFWQCFQEQSNVAFCFTLPLALEWWHGTGFRPGWRNTGSSQTGRSCQGCCSGWRAPTGSSRAPLTGFPLWEAWKTSGTGRSLREPLGLCGGEVKKKVLSGNITFKFSKDILQSHMHNRLCAPDCHPPYHCYRHWNI